MVEYGKLAKKGAANLLEINSQRNDVYLVAFFIPYFHFGASNGSRLIYEVSPYNLSGVAKKGGFQIKFLSRIQY